MPIHPTAIVDPAAEIDETAEVGPYSIIQGPVRIGAGTRLLSHVHVLGRTTVGENCVIHMGAVIGNEAQDLTFGGNSAGLVVGDRNIFRENVTIHRSTHEEEPTRIGNDCLLMAGSHVGHDSIVGNRVIIANNSMLAGHVHIYDSANISGGCAVHQFTRVGRLAMLRGLAGVSKDVPPFMIAWSINRISSPNVVGMRRASFSREARHEIRAAYKILFRQRSSMDRAVKRVQAMGFGPEVEELVSFIEESKRGVCSRLEEE